MNKKLTLRKRIIFTGIVALMVWANLTWDYFHGGVPTHYILHSKDLPGFSNWWGGIAVPLITWFLLSLIDRKMNNITDKANGLASPLYGFLGALLFGIILSILFTYGSNLPGYMMIAVIIMSFFVPFYKAELLLGFILGMIYTFGGILPILIGVILTILFAIAYKVVRYAVIILVSKIRPGSNK
jgi:hypothetical protein